MPPKTKKSSTSPPASAAEEAAALRSRALRLLARREHSRAELERKLAPHAPSHEVLEDLLQDLIGKKQLSDERYAESRARWLARKYGAARIRQELKSKGVPGEIVDRVSGEGDLETARAILARKYRTPAETPEERARRARFLHGRGFSGDVIRRLLSSAEAP